MQINLSDKRVLAAAITAAIVIVAVIGVESFLLWVRPVPVVYMPQPATVVQAPVQQSLPLNEEQLDMLESLARKNSRLFSVQDQRRLEELERRNAR